MNIYLQRIKTQAAESARLQAENEELKLKLQQANTDLTTSHLSNANSQTTKSNRRVMETKSDQLGHLIDIYLDDDSEDAELAVDLVGECVV